nr:ribonuclease H-like domain-containing protein [Tanacetum cinerariifolium]
MGLDDSYMQLKSIILSRDPLHDAKGAYVLIFSEESHRAVVVSSGTGPSQRAQSSVFNSSVNNMSPFPSSSSSSSLSDEQISKLFSLIKDNSLNDKGKGVQANIAGANQHLTYTNKNLVNVVDIFYLRIRVSHPNITEALITKVARDSKFIVGFGESKCFLMSHDLMDVKLIRIGKQVNGLCYFNSQEGDLLKNKELDHVNFFDEVVHEGPDTSNDDTSLNAHDQSDGSNSSQFSSPTIDQFEGEMKHSQGSNGSDDNQPLRRSERTSVFPKKYNEYVIDSKVKYELEKYVGYSNLTSENFCFTTELNKAFKPKNYWKACKYQHRVKAMKKEMGALYRNDTWDITYLPKGRKSIGGKWVFKIKYKSNGESGRYKARYVVKGYNQKERIDFGKTFSPVVKIVTVRCVINLVVQNGWTLYQLDINNAFLYGNNVVEIQKFKDFLRTQFQIKDLGKLKLLACKPFATPLEQNLSITNESSDVDKVLDNITEYQKLIKKLIYLTRTRPNISYPVHCLSQFMHKPLRSHVKIALRVLRHLKGNHGKGIHIVKQPEAFLKAFVDVDWANQAAIKIAANPIFNERTKHLEIDLHFVRENILSGVIETQKIKTAVQPADIFTKGLDKSQHENLILKLGLMLIDVLQKAVGVFLPILKSEAGLYNEKDKERVVNSALFFLETLIFSI